MTFPVVAESGINEGKKNQNLNPFNEVLISIQNGAPTLEIMEEEPNDIIDEANELTFEQSFNPINSEQFAKFDTVDDIDYYKIENPKTQHVYLLGLEGRETDLEINLLNVSEEEIIPDFVNQDGGSKWLAFYLLPKGTYYIATSDLNRVGEGDFYGLSAITDEVIHYSFDQFRMSGQDRYETASQIAFFGDLYTPGGNTIILARDNNFPDALAGAPLAYRENAPILLNPKDRLHKRVKENIHILGAKKVILLGGEAAISVSVESELIENGLSVERIGGKNRFETAALIAQKLGDYDQAVIADGGNFPDALSIAPYAAFKGIPILLSEKNRIPIETKAALQSVEKTIIVGGINAISQKIEEKLAYTNPIRFSGKDRYDTSVNISNALGYSGKSVIFATGQNFADALTGSILAAKYGDPIILVKKEEVPPSVQTYIRQNQTVKQTVLGGENVITEKVLKKLEELAN